MGNLFLLCYRMARRSGITDKKIEHSSQALIGVEWEATQTKLCTPSNKSPIEVDAIWLENYAPMIWEAFMNTLYKISQGHCTLKLLGQEGQKGILVNGLQKSLSKTGI